MTQIKAIETTYKGYRFRSRLEARWAVFFDAIGLKWGYETEGFEAEVNGSVVRWLPDFHLPELDRYVEVKPLGVANFAKRSYVECVVDTVYLWDSINMATLVGNPWPDEYGLLLHGPGSHQDDTGLILPDLAFTIFAGCRRCRGIDLAFVDISPDYVFYNEGVGWVEECDTYRWTKVGAHTCNGNERGPLVYEGHILDAYAAARSARFEHGESP